MTVKSGGAAVFNLVVNPVGGATFASPINFTATGLPTGAIATFSPSTIAAGSGATNVTLSIQMSNATAMTRPAPSHWTIALCLLFLPLAGLGRWRRIAESFSVHRKISILGLVMVGATLGMSGCGSTTFGQLQRVGTPASSNAYTVTITATSGKQQQSTTVSLSVQ